MSHYTHLTIEERENAMVMLAQGLSIRAIAYKMKRSPSTLSRELKRNRLANGNYRASFAEKKYHKRRKHCGPQPIMNNPVVAEYVKERLLLKWTPEQIAGLAKLEKFPVAFSYPTIYRAIDNKVLPFALKKEMRFKSKYKKHKTNDKRGTMQDILSIHDRPKSVNERKQIGHWESDTVLGQRKTGSFGTHVERKTGYLVAFKLEKRTSKEFNAATIQAFNSIPKKYHKTFTVDRGKEFTLHRELSEALQTKIYFCDPYASWQKGLNENTNGLLRQFFPKKTSFAPVTNEVLQKVVDLINNRPRKRLGWKTPAELFLKNIRS